MGDVFTAWYNIQSAENVFYDDLENHREFMYQEYKSSLELTELFMLQTATFVANLPSVQELFYKGRQAVAKEGGGKGKKKAEKIRRELEAYLKQSWDGIKEKYSTRQLHFHLPPDVSFLRMHQPQKYGDDLSSIRHTTHTTNLTQKVTSGYESGRIYAGIRGSVPVYYNNPKTLKREFVGALESGASFHEMLNTLHSTFNYDFAILMSNKHMMNTMWPDMIKLFLKSHSLINGFLVDNSTQESFIKALLEDKEGIKHIRNYSTRTLVYENNHYVIFSLPLRDYLGEKDLNRKDIGRIVMWKNINKRVFELKETKRNNVLIAAVSFVSIEIILFVLVYLKFKLNSAEQLSHIDGLTHINNRRALDEKLTEEWGRAVRNDSTLGVIMIDVDFFKKFNDEYGHLAGDDCLKQVAETLSQHINRASDFIARYGGEEFCVLLPNTDEHQVYSVAEKLRVSVEMLKIPHKFNVNTPYVTISLGCALHHANLNEKKVEAIEDLISKADDNLYQAKINGRNQVVIN